MGEAKRRREQGRYPARNGGRPAREYSGAPKGRRVWVPRVVEVDVPMGGPQPVRMRFEVDPDGQVYHADRKGRHGGRVKVRNRQLYHLVHRQIRLDDADRARSAAMAGEPRKVRPHTPGCGHPVEGA